MAPRRGRPPRESTLLESYAPSTPARPTLTEKQFMAQVQELARVLGWHVYHPWLSIRSERGFPDLTLARPGRLLFIELKADSGRATPAQEQWLGWLREAGAEAHVVRPSNWDELVEILQRKEPLS